MVHNIIPQKEKIRIKAEQITCRSKDYLSYVLVI